MERKQKVKKPFYKKWWFWIIIILAVGSLASLGKDDADDTLPTSTPTATIAPTPTPEATPEPAPTEDTLTFELIAGEAGEYGELFTMNKDTEFEETYYIYHVPAGTYTVTNTGEYMAQLSVYSDKIITNSSGWEEPAEVFYGEVLNVDASVTITVEEGSFIEIHEPARFSFELNK